MVAMDEIISEPELHGQRRSASIPSAPSVVKKSSSMNSGRGIWGTLIHREVAEVNGGPTILTDQQLGSSDDLFIIHYSLFIIHWLLSAAPATGIIPPPSAAGSTRILPVTSTVPIRISLSKAIR